MLTRFKKIRSRVVFELRRFKAMSQSISFSKEHQWASIDEFLADDTFEAGVHTIPLRFGGRAQVLVIGDLHSVPVNKRIPVFFNGALGGREGTRPPYFSGRRLLREIEIPGIAVSDPIFDIDSDIRLGWYTGLPEWRYQEQLGEILQHFSSVLGRDLLTIGGSGGGYAALEAASRLNASAFVWNPQTCILWYRRTFVWKWLEILFPDTWHPGDSNWKFVRKRFMEPSGLTFDLGLEPPPARFLYLQNDVDWHVRLHFAHYVYKHGLIHTRPGLFVDGDDRFAVMSHFGSGTAGHVRPPRSVIVAAVVRMLDKSLTVRQVYEGLLESIGEDGPDLSLLPVKLVPPEFRENYVTSFE